MGCMDSWFSGKESKRKRRKGPEQRDRVCGMHLTPATRGKAMLPTLPQKGAAFIPPKMPVPPSGPSKQHNSVPRLRFIPAKVVYGSKRLVPSGANPLHH
ncbi:hypothetical protein IEQ34_023293 [Dendrobium chrysotoxum]|uniref:Uncharacterized protein n=1 Tax=Dendrobium chrysotoxum TaxID=161865 RepID=A0AAV7FU21_DENCH|nr:hypothetical protein IEQ34_025619 [Dendrobium chrysotoxum]KAH0446282.1 hypothetical protein IEQ34_024883 [Dendrobium chrysotoxum]KAH0446680.1 hypothetical protein IEQ34_024495 [Dendrobium chrysotoxum]KAH0446773.1 hypothetical protein IEQ34_024399 [Dendrobium chrysotoxum]KAH0447064.1 hypothetical protein IEQ34_024113 [Dendrobium chrysotoxum]